MQQKTEAREDMNGWHGKWIPERGRRNAESFTYPSWLQWLNLKRQTTGGLMKATNPVSQRQRIALTYSREGRVSV